MIEEKVTVRNSIKRVIFVALSILIQVVWLVSLANRVTAYSTVISLLTTIVAAVIVLRLFAKQMNAAFKFPWIIIILTFPVFGICLYLLTGHSFISHKMRGHFESINAKLRPHFPDTHTVIQELEAETFAVANQFRYVNDFGQYPVYDNTDVSFYPEAELSFADQIEAIKQAKHFIFLEYHAIEEATAFGAMRDALAERVQHGVEVRIIYDDLGSIGFIDTDFIRRMEHLGIQCRVFNPAMPVLNVFMNNRDHRKITVIDGIIGFTGGYNLADEYFNIVQPYGRWKDTGLKLTGDAVRSLTLIFLEMWNAIKTTDTSVDAYLPDINYTANEHCFVQPYADTPLDAEFVGENVYLNMIKSAEHYIWFATPYLIITDEMNRELGLAAKRGVDVRILTPGIPDKKLVFQATRSYYAALAQSGVKIFEFTPGFLHAKQCICDDKLAVVGTINLDYRSLYFHFENAVLLYRCKAVTDIRQDFVTTFALSENVTPQYLNLRSMPQKLGQYILRLFSPLL